jgi:hypothetical protein
VLRSFLACMYFHVNILLFLLNLITRYISSIYVCVFYLILVVNVVLGEVMGLQLKCMMLFSADVCRIVTIVFWQKFRACLGNISVLWLQYCTMLMLSNVKLVGGRNFLWSFTDAWKVTNSKLSYIWVMLSNQSYLTSGLKIMEILLIVSEKCKF